MWTDYGLMWRDVVIIGANGAPCPRNLFQLATSTAVNQMASRPQPDGLINGFERRRLPGDGVEIDALVGGSGPPLLLLHGYPQTRVMWSAVAPALAERFTVVVPDLRGYGRSAKPEGDAAHTVYSKRAMARDQVATMRALGFERFAVAGHDRGARVGYRLALDHPSAVSALAVLDITADGGCVGRRVCCERHAHVPLVLPGAATAATGNSDRRGSGVLPALYACELGGEAASCSTPGAWPTTSPAFPIQPAFTPAAKIIAPAGRSIACTMKRAAAGC